MHLTFSSPLAWTSFWALFVLSRALSVAIAPELESKPDVKDGLDTFRSSHHARAQIEPHTPPSKRQLPAGLSSPIRRIKSSPALVKQDNPRKSPRPKRGGPRRGRRNGGNIGEAIRAYGGTGLSPHMCRAILQGAGQAWLKEHSALINLKTHYANRYQDLMGDVESICTYLFDEDNNPGYVFKQLSSLEKTTRQASLAYQRRHRAGQMAKGAKNELDNIRKAMNQFRHDGSPKKEFDNTRKVMNQLRHDGSWKNGPPTSPTGSQRSWSSVINDAMNSD